MIHENLGNKTINDLAAEMTKLGSTVLTLRMRGESGKVARLMLLAKDDDAERISQLLEDDECDEQHDGSDY
jgi:hypothetical protein